MSGASRATHDRGVGFTAVAVILTIGGALLMILNPNSTLGGWGFALAITAAVAAVMAAQLYW